MPSVKRGRSRPGARRKLTHHDKRACLTAAVVDTREAAAAAQGAETPPWELPEDKAATRAHGGQRWWAQVEEGIQEYMGPLWPRIQRKGNADWLAEKNAHPRDAHITFRDEDHSYWYDGRAQFPRPSSTGFVKQYFEPFDKDRTITRMMDPKSRKGWPRPGYYQSDGKTAMTRAQIKAMWACNGAVASEVGTAIHQMVEWACNAEAAGKPMLLAKLRGVLSPESQMFLDWNDARKEATDEGDDVRMDHYRTEWSVYSTPAQLAGQIDWVGIDRRGHLHIRDWKTCKELLHRTRAYPRDGKAPCHKLRDCDHVKYELQQNVYKHILETEYGFTVASMGIVVFNRRNPDCKDGRDWVFGSLPVRDLQPVVTQMMALRTAAMASRPPLDAVAACPVPRGVGMGAVEATHRQHSSRDRGEDERKDGGAALSHRSGRVLAVMRNLKAAMLGSSRMAVRAEPVQRLSLRPIADAVAKHRLLQGLRDRVQLHVHVARVVEKILAAGVADEVTAPVALDNLLRPWVLVGNKPIRAVVLADAPRQDLDSAQGMPVADSVPDAGATGSDVGDEPSWLRRVEKWAVQGVLLLYRQTTRGRSEVGDAAHRKAWSRCWVRVVRALGDGVPVFYWAGENNSAADDVLQGCPWALVLASSDVNARLDAMRSACSTVRW